VIGVGSIKSRDDARRALDAVSAFFARTSRRAPFRSSSSAQAARGEGFPRGPEDVAPDGLDQAKRVGGIRDDE
jgi:hypothetical protein